MNRFALLPYLIVVTPSWASPIIIDDFAEGAAKVVAGRSVIDPDTGEPIESAGAFQTDLASVFGGARGLGIQDVNLLFPLGTDDGLVSVEVLPANGELSMTGSQRPEHSGVQYGGFFEYQLGLDVSLETDIVVDVLRYSEGNLAGGSSRLAVTLYSAPTVSHRVVLDIPPDFDGGELSFPLDSFSLVDRTNIDLISVDYWPHPFDYSITIDQIRIVPESSSLGLQFVTMVGFSLMMWRRRDYTKTPASMYTLFERSSLYDNKKSAIKTSIRTTRA